MHSFQHAPSPVHNHLLCCRRTADVRVPQQFHSRHARAHSSSSSQRSHRRHRNTGTKVYARSSYMRVCVAYGAGSASPKTLPAHHTIYARTSVLCYAASVCVFERVLPSSLSTRTSPMQLLLSAERVATNNKHLFNLPRCASSIYKSNRYAR